MSNMSEIIAKIQKLFALANQPKNNSEAEASSAMAKAQELLAKYNLDIAMVVDAETKAKKTPDEPMSGPREKVQVSRSAMYRWQQEFWHELSLMNYCYHWTEVVWEEKKGRSRKVKRHVILGGAANVAAVHVMGDYLTEVIERDLPYPNKERLSKSALSWREGMAQRLIERIKENRAKMEQEGFKAEDGSQVTALAMVSMADREERANYDARWGAGSWARKAKNEADYAANREKRQAEYAERERVRAMEEELRKAKMTPKQREKAEQKEERETRRMYARYYRNEAKEAARLDRSAFRAGQKDANRVNLDDQIKGN